jgi:hypothetical protein
MAVTPCDMYVCNNVGAHIYVCVHTRLHVHIYILPTSQVVSTCSALYMYDIIYVHIHIYVETSYKVRGLIATTMFNGILLEIV